MVSIDPPGCDNLGSLGLDWQDLCRGGGGGGGVTSASKLKIWWVKYPTEVNAYLNL